MWKKRQNIYWLFGMREIIKKARGDLKELKEDLTIIWMRGRFNQKVWCLRKHAKKFWAHLFVGADGATEITMPFKTSTNLQTSTLVYYYLASHFFPLLYILICFAFVNPYPLLNHIQTTNKQFTSVLWSYN